MKTTIKNLECCCCGERTLGRQWPNRDTGYGLCPKCADWIESKHGAEEVKEMAGIRGIHFAPEPAPVI